MRLSARPQRPCRRRVCDFAALAPKRLERVQGHRVGHRPGFQPLQADVRRSLRVRSPQQAQQLRGRGGGRQLPPGLVDDLHRLPLKQGAHAANQLPIQHHQRHRALAPAQGLQHHCGGRMGLGLKVFAQKALQISPRADLRKWRVVAGVQVEQQSGHIRLVQKRLCQHFSAAHAQAHPGRRPQRKQAGRGRQFTAGRPFQREVEQRGFHQRRPSGRAQRGAGLVPKSGNGQGRSVCGALTKGLGGIHHRRHDAVKTARVTLGPSLRPGLAPEQGPGRQTVFHRLAGATVGVGCQRGLTAGRQRQHGFHAWLPSTTTCKGSTSLFSQCDKGHQQHGVSHQDVLALQPCQRFTRNAVPGLMGVPPRINADLLHHRHRKIAAQARGRI